MWTIYIYIYMQYYSLTGMHPQVCSSMDMCERLTATKILKECGTLRKGRKSLLRVYWEFIEFIEGLLTANNI